MQRTEEGLGSPGTGVTDGGESPSGYWESNFTSLEKRPVLLTSEISLQPCG